MVLANQLDIVVVDKREKKVVVVNVAISIDSNIMEKEYQEV